MTTSFQDRIDRIAPKHADPVDLIGQGNAGSLPPLNMPTVDTPNDFNRRFRRTFILNVLLGFVWMVFASYPLSNHEMIQTYLETAPWSTDNAKAYMTTLMIACAASVVAMASVFRGAMRGSLHIGLAIGAGLGFIIGMGPASFMDSL